MTKMPNKNERFLESLPYAIGVILSFLVAFYIRTLPKASVFLSNGFVRFAENDPWYHLRNIESILHNFPHVLWFDAYTQYPYGTEQVFAPLYDLMVASVLWILGFGHPDQNLINTVCAYFPAVLGSIIVVPIYYTAKWIFDDRRIGLLAAIIIAVSPGSFLQRSVLGFNDHHVAETLLTTITAMYLVMALKISQKYDITFADIKNRDFSNFKPVLPYLLLAGVSLGIYSLTWKGGLFFCLALGVYFTGQHIIDHIHGKPTVYLAVSGVIIFAISMLMVMTTPNLGGTGYKELYLGSLLAGIITFPILTGISISFNERKINNYFYPIVVVLLFISGILLARLISQSAYGLLLSVFTYFTQTGGALTIGEASPFFSREGNPLWSQFALAGYFSFVAIPLLAYEAIKKNSKEKIFLLAWSLVILWAMLQQNRFSYYFVANVAILAAYLGIKIADYAGLKSFAADFKAKVKSPSDLSEFSKGIFKNTAFISIPVILVIVWALVYPSYGMAVEQADGGGPSGPWMDATLWLRDNTPDPGLNFYEQYPAPENFSAPYSYPDTAYGVMSWWDYGHWIEVIGKRIPNANPFQQGIGGRRVSINETNQPGAASFFTAQSEDEASKVLKNVDPRPGKMGARYIISDERMATEIFMAMAAWTLDTDGYFVPYWTGTGYQNLPSTRYYDSMEARLHIFDGNGLKHYRLVHESKAAQTSETGYKQVYNLFYEGNIPVVNSGYVKIFEYVKGANITGTASPNEKVKISGTIVTGQNRAFEYSQSTTSDSQGRYNFTVPYSTEGPIPGQTQFDTAPSGPYKLSYGSTVNEVRVKEEAVLKGEEIKV